MEMMGGGSQAPAPAPASRSKYHQPYFSAPEVEHLSEKQRGKLSATQEERERQRACGFADAIGTRLGFPRRTVATAQSLYNRFHLFFPRKDFNYYDVVLGSLYVSTKMHDTLKKPRDLLMASYAVRFPEQAAKSRSVAGEIDIDPVTLENDRQRLLGVERVVLEMLCYNLTSRMPFPYVIKICRYFGVSKRLTKSAWRMAVDCHRTLMPLQYPPHVVALGGLYTAALLSSFEQPPSESLTEAAAMCTALTKPGPWQVKFQAETADIEEIAHAILDLFIQATQAPSQTTSPSTPSSPAPHSTSRASGAQAAPAVPVPYNADQLMRLKIAMREAEQAQGMPPPPPPPLTPRLSAAGGEDVFGDEDPAMAAKNEGTVRFLFGPRRLVGEGA